MSTHQVKFEKNMSTFSLMMTGITTIFGSGWLLATQKISEVAGPAGILAWAIGAFVAIIIGCFCIEIGTIHPSAGGLGYYSNITHGRFSGFITQWINWLSILTIPPVEAQAITRYLSSANIHFHDWYSGRMHILTPSGITVCILFMLFFMLMNYWGLKLFTRFNNTLTVVKIIVPLLTMAVLLSTGFHPHNMGHNIHEFAPYGFKAVGTAAISCGVVMSFNGFQSPLNFSEEIKSPTKQLPIAVIGSVIITFLLYVLLQYIYTGKVPPQDINTYGWHGINYRSPYVDLLLAANLQVMAWVVMSTAVIAPTSCGATDIASASRILMTLSRAKFFPKFIGKLDKKHKSPRYAILINTIIGCSFIIAFPSWALLVAVISALHVFSYLSMPVVAIAHRRHEKLHNIKQHNYFRLPFATFFAIVILFILGGLLFFISFPNILHMALLLVPGLMFFAYYEYKNHGLQNMLTLIKSGAWLLYFIVGITLIGYLGNNVHKAHNIISLKGSIYLLIALTITSFIYGIFSANTKAHYPTPKTHNKLSQNTLTR